MAQMSRQEIRATRRELAKLTSDLDVFANRASSSGKKGGGADFPIILREARSLLLNPSHRAFLKEWEPHFF